MHNMTTKPEPWQIDGYIAVQLLCCFSWRMGGVRGFCDIKLGKFYSGMTLTTRGLLQGRIERLQYELYQDVNRSIKEDLPLFCTMIPAEYRQDAHDKCKAILRANSFKMDEIVSKGIEKGLMQTV